jgi:DUF1009 family protein
MSAHDAAARRGTEGKDGPIGLICGGGAMPFAVADAIARRGRIPILFAIENFADRERVAGYAHHWIALGQAGRLSRMLRDAGCREVAFIGNVARPRLSEVRLDWTTFRLLPRFAASLRGGDNHLLSSVGGALEEMGFRMVGAHEVAPEILVPQGILGRVAPQASARADIARGFAALDAIGPFDVGQAAVVANNHILAIEGIEGTDLMLERVTELRRIGRIRTSSGVGVIVKAPKHGQDMRYDLPSIGPKTVEGLAAAGLAGLAVSAGTTIIAEAQRMVAIADEAGVFVIGARADGTVD